MTQQPTAAALALAAHLDETGPVGYSPHHMAFYQLRLTQTARMIDRLGQIARIDLEELAARLPDSPVSPSWNDQAA